MFHRIQNLSYRKWSKVTWKVNLLHNIKIMKVKSVSDWGWFLSDRLRHRENVQARIRHELTCSLTPYQIWTGFSYLIFSYFGNSVNSSDAWAKTWTSSSLRNQKHARFKSHTVWPMIFEAFCFVFMINFWLTVLNFWVAIFILNNKARRILEP